MPSNTQRCEMSQSWVQLNTIKQGLLWVFCFLTHFPNIYYSFILESYKAKERGWGWTGEGAEKENTQTQVNNTGDKSWQGLAFAKSMKPLITGSHFNALLFLEPVLSLLFTSLPTHSLFLYRASRRCSNHWPEKIHRQRYLRTCTHTQRQGEGEVIVLLGKGAGEENGFGYKHVEAREAYPGNTMTQNLYFLTSISIYARRLFWC